MRIIDFNQFNEGLFDRFRKKGDKIPQVLSKYGYNSAQEFVLDVKKINHYSGTFKFNQLPETVSIENIISAFKLKNEYEELFEIVDELNNLLRELMDEGVEIQYVYSNTNQCFDIRITPTKLDAESLYLISGVLMESEGRGEINFHIRGIDGRSLRVTVYSEEPQEPKGLSQSQTPYERAALQNIEMQNQANLNIQQMRNANNDNIRREDAECPQCEGNGYIYVNPDHEVDECPMCGGSGMLWDGEGDIDDLYVDMT